MGGWVEGLTWRWQGGCRRVGPGRAGTGDGGIGGCGSFVCREGKGKGSEVKESLASRAVRWLGLWALRI